MVQHLLRPVHVRLCNFASGRSVHDNNIAYQLVHIRWDNVYGQSISRAAPFQMVHYMKWYTYLFLNHRPSLLNRNNFLVRPFHLGQSAGRYRVAHVGWAIVTSAGRCTME